MLKNYILTSVRSLLKHRSFSIINIFGLSISMAVCMLIILILQDQFSYDNFHKKRDRIYRIQSKENLSTHGFIKLAGTAWPIAKELKDNYPFVEESVAIKKPFNNEGTCNGKRFNVTGLFATPRKKVRKFMVFNDEYGYFQ